VSVEGMSNRQLLAHVLEGGALLAKKEFELAKTELRADLKKEVAMAKGLTAAGICALCTLNLLLVAIAMALGGVMVEWGAALIVAKLQLRRHPQVAVGAGVVLLALAGGVVFAVWRAHKREELPAKARRIRIAIGRAVEKPHKVARGEAPVWEKILAAVGTTVA